MKYPGDQQDGLIEGRLIKRYKRFLADVELSRGEFITAHCPNTGSMLGCAEPGSGVWLSLSNDPKRKYAHTWQLVENAPDELACIHSALANKVVAEAISEGRIPEFIQYDRVKPEVRYGQEKSRIDFLLSHADEECYVEVKCVTLHAGEGLGMFPDSVSNRGARHLRELTEIKSSGARAVLFFCVQNSAIKRVTPAHHIDPVYGETLEAAVAAGVEVLAYNTDLSPKEIKLSVRLPFELSNCVF